MLSNIPFFKKDENKECCCYCGEDFLSAYIKIDIKKHKKRPVITKDHLVPLSKGGINNNYNKIDCCYSCNQEKDSMTIIEYLVYLLEKRTNCKGTLKNEIEIKIYNCLIIKKYIDEQGYKLYTQKYFGKNINKRKNNKKVRASILYNYYIIENIFFKLLYKKELKSFSNISNIINKKGSLA